LYILAVKFIGNEVNNQRQFIVSASVSYISNILSTSVILNIAARDSFIALVKRVGTFVNNL